MFDDSFFSADRLVEFGLGMAMAQQMVNTMNKTMQSMQVPGSMATMPQLGNIHVAIDGKAMGPLTEAEFARLASERRINKDTLVWIPGMLAWKPVEQVPEVLKIVALTPPPLPTM